MKKTIILLAALASLMVSCTKSEPELVQSQAEPVNAAEPKPDYLNPNYVAIDWTNTDVLSYDPENCTFDLKMNGEIPEISKGSILSIDADTTGCVCIVNDCIVNKDVVTVSGTLGTIYDIFGNTELILSTEEVPSDALTKAASGDLIIGVPTSVVIKNEAGENEIHEFVDTKAYHNILSWNYSKNYTYSYGALSMYSKTNLSFDLGLYLDIQFKTFSIKPKYVEMYIQGTAGASQTYGIDLSYSWSWDFEKKITSVTLPRVKFMVGYVPVWITLGADLNILFEAEANAKASLTTGFSDKLTIKCGFIWNNGRMSPINSCTNKYSIYYPSLTGSANAIAKAYIYPSFFMKLYDIVGPTFDVMPYIGASASKTLGSKMELNLLLGIDMRAGLTLLNESWKTSKVNVFEKKFPYKF